MPRRTREHILEEESRKHFENLIPDNWIIRKPDPDYGIDAEVEIFDGNGSPTGVLFLVQLKATDQKNLSKALKLSFKKDMLQYYNSLELPVLVVRYHSPTKNIFMRWAHSIDLYYSGPNTSNYTITFSKRNQWSENTPSLIENYLNKRRILRECLPLPIELSFDYDIEFSNITYKMKLESKFRELIKEQGLPIKMTPDKQTDFKAVITIASNEVKISFLDLKTFTMHNLQGKDGEYDEQSLPYDLLSLIGCSFFQTGCKNIAFQILIKNLPFSTLIESFQFLALLGMFIGSEKNIESALGLMETILTSNRQKKIGITSDVFMFAVTPSILRFGCPQDLHKRFSKIMLRLSTGCEKEGQKEIAGVYYYNLANMMRNSPFFSNRQIISWYKSAVRLWGGYHKREYFWAEIGGVLFNCNKYLCSSRFYKKAIAIEEKPVTIALFADALLFAGKYKDALDLFEKYLRDEENPEIEWILKSNLIEYLIKVSGIESQIRSLKKACNLATIDKEVSFSSKEAASLCIKKLETIYPLDLLCTRMWTNLANLYEFLGETEKGLYATITVCLLEPFNLTAWLACLVWAVKIKSPLLGGIVYLAYEKNGEQFIRFLMDKIATEHSQIDLKMVRKIKVMFDEIREHHATQAHHHFSVIRLPDGKNSYKELKLENVHLP